MLPVNGLPNAFLQVNVQPAGAATSSYGVSSGVTYAAAAPAATYSMQGASGGAAYSQPMTYSAGPAAPVTYSTGTPTAAAAPVTTMGSSPYAQGNVVPMQTSPMYTQGSAMPVQTYSGAQTTYSASTPMISSPQAMPVQTQTYGATAPMQTYASPPSPTYMQQPQTYMVQGGQMYGGGAYGGGAYGTGAYKLAVSIIQAQ